MKASLVNALRKGTNVALKIDSHTITLVPHPETRSAGGVYNRGPGTPRDPQEFYFEPVSVDGAKVSTEGAKAHQWAFQMVGRYDCVMAIGDTWTDGTTQYRIDAMLPENGYEKRGLVVALGKDPSYGT